MQFAIGGGRDGHGYLTTRLSTASATGAQSCSNGSSRSPRRARYPRRKAAPLIDALAVGLDRQHLHHPFAAAHEQPLPATAIAPGRPATCAALGRRRLESGLTVGPGAPHLEPKAAALHPGAHAGAEGADLVVDAKGRSLQIEQTVSPAQFLRVIGLPFLLGPHHRAVIEPGQHLIQAHARRGRREPEPPSRRHRAG